MRAIGDPCGTARDTWNPVGVAPKRSLLRGLPPATGQLEEMVGAAEGSLTVAAATTSSPQA